jgi:Fe-S-cluster-containing hydrogenase component 2
MEDGFLINGTMSSPEIAHNPNIPSEARLSRGPAVLIECTQKIPCNPCEDACPFKAITIGRPISQIPRVDYNKCTGCGICISSCPGLAIFVFGCTSNHKCRISIPYEMLPLPEKGQVVMLLNRKGDQIGEGKIVNIENLERNNLTVIITLETDMTGSLDVRNILI